MNQAFVFVTFFSRSIEIKGINPPARPPGPTLPVEHLKLTSSKDKVQLLHDRLGDIVINRAGARLENELISWFIFSYGSDFYE